MSPAQSFLYFFSRFLMFFHVLFVFPPEKVNVWKIATRQRYRCKKRDCTVYGCDRRKLETTIQNKAATLLYTVATLLYKAATLLYRAATLLYKAATLLYKAATLLYKAATLLYKAATPLYKAATRQYKVKTPLYFSCFSIENPPPGSAILVTHFGFSETLSPEGCLRPARGRFWARARLFWGPRASKLGATSGRDRYCL